MPSIVLSASPAQPSHAGGFSVVYHLDGRPDPMPRRVVVIKTTEQALAALEEYKRDATATGLPMAVNMRLDKGSRAPNGFKAATEKMPFHHRVNV